jgi:hypothetical protein
MQGPQGSASNSLFRAGGIGARHFWLQNRRKSRSRSALHLHIGNYWVPSQMVNGGHRIRRTRFGPRRHLDHEGRGMTRKARKGTALTQRPCRGEVRRFRGFRALPCFSVVQMPFMFFFAFLAPLRLDCFLCVLRGFVVRFVLTSWIKVTLTPPLNGDTLPSSPARGCLPILGFQAQFRPAAIQPV